MLYVMWHFQATSFKLANIKTLIFIISILTWQNVLAQIVNDKDTSNTNFYFRYGKRGLGSNLHKLYSTLRVSKNKFTYTEDQSNSAGTKIKRTKVLGRGILRQSSIDSILSIVQGLEDSIIYKSNPCISSGVIIDLVSTLR